MWEEKCGGMMEEVRTRVPVVGTYLCVINNIINNNTDTNTIINNNTDTSTTTRTCQA